MTDRLPVRLRVAAAFALTTTLALVGLTLFVHQRVQSTLVARSRASLTTQLDALAGVPARRRPKVVAAMSGEFFAQVTSVNGAPLATSSQVKGSPKLVGRLPPASGEVLRLHRPVWLASEDEPEPSMLLLNRRGSQVVVVGTTNEAIEDTLDGVRNAFLVGGPIALLVASGLGYVVAGTALRPVERIRRQAAAISARNTGERLPLPAARDEIRSLGETLNAMLDRLSAGLQRERRFVAEASHELRTPLALLRVELDLALARERTSDELRAALYSASEEVDRLTRLAEDMLFLATSDEDRFALARAQFDVGTLLGSIADRFRAKATVERRSISVSGSFPLVLTGDRDHLDRAVSNVVDNALRHGSGNVDLAACGRNGLVTLSVADEGTPVAADVRGRAFERFSRGPGARSADGRGLGLSIVRAIVEEHRGTVTMNRTDAGRTVVMIELPRDGSSRP